MRTHNIGFYEDLTKIIFELSSNIIKYTPYFFCCIGKQNTENVASHLGLFCSLTQFSSKNEEEKQTPDAPKNGNKLIQMLRMEKSTHPKWVNVMRRE